MHRYDEQLRGNLRKRPVRNFPKEEISASSSVHCYAADGHVSDCLLLIPYQNNYV